MAISVAQLDAITHRFVEKKLANNVYRSKALLTYMYAKRKKLDGGSNLNSPVIHGDIDSSTGGWFSGAEQLNVSEKDDITTAQVNWKEIYESILLSQSDILKNRGVKQILNLVDSKVKIAKMRMDSRLSDGIFSDGTNSKVFNGLEEIIHATGAYGGLAISDILDEDGNNAWLGKIQSNSGTDRALSLALIQKAMGDATEGDAKPGVACSRQDVYNELWNLLSPAQRTVTSDTFSGLGHKGVLRFNGIDFLIDSHAAAQRMYFLNLDYLSFYVHEGQDMKVQSFSQLEDKNAIQKRVVLMGNLLCCARKYQGAIDDISVAS